MCLCLHVCMDLNAELFIINANKHLFNDARMDISKCITKTSV